MKRLAKRLQELGVREVSLMSFENAEDLQKWPGLPVIKPVHPLKPIAHWTAISPTLLTISASPYAGTTTSMWFERLHPVERIGTYLLYYVAQIP
jgi:hypothetical protein